METTVRRNPPRRARPTPSSSVVPLQSPPPRIISSFPIDDILSIEIPEKQHHTGPPSSSSENLKVFLRIRPLIPQREAVKAEMKKTKNAWPKNPKSTTNVLPKKVKKSNEVCVTVNDPHSVTISPPLSLQDGKRIKSEVYEGFSQVFSSEASQREVYKIMVNPLVEDFLKGKSGMLAALGPSGSGKTHTIFGCGRDPGMVPLALRQILSHEEGDKMQLRRVFYLSMFEICSEKGKSEKVFDLSQDGADLSIQQSSLKGIREAVLHDAHRAESLIACGLLKRATAMTNSNSQSSRSQCIINIRCEYKEVDGKVGDSSNSAVLTIVDLAGAEREKKTGNQGVRLLESNFINNTSMVFGLCLRSLLEHQKNRKKPMQKHFQSSLLTRYLRDYLEGKKRMALLLTVRPGEEDYLDTSFVLRQASPYMKIKFDIIDKQGILSHSKRPVQTMPTVVKLKRTKLSQNENFEINQGSVECPQLLNEEAAVEGVMDGSLTEVLVQSEEIITIEANGRNILRVDHIELERKERNFQILQNFGKALWKVLKGYKRKLEVAENEILTLRDGLISEKTRSAKLENQLRDWQSNCCCKKEVSSEVSLREVDEFSVRGSLDFEEHQSTDCNEVAENVNCTPRNCITNEKTKCSELENQLNDWQSNCCFSEGVSIEVSSVEVDECRRKSSSDFEDHQSTDCNEVKSEVYSCHLEGSPHMRNEELLDFTTAQKHERSIEDATSVEAPKNHNETKEETAYLNGKTTAAISGPSSCTDQEHEQEEESSVSTSQVTFINRYKNDLLEVDRTLLGSECTVSSSEPSLFIVSDSSFPLEEDQTQNEDDMTAQKQESSLEDTTSVEDPKNRNETKEETTHLNGKTTAVISGQSYCTDQEHEREKESSVITSQATSINTDKKDLLEEDHMLFDSVLPECTVRYSESSLFAEYNISFPVGEDQTQNKEDKKLESSIEDATSVEDPKNPYEMKVEMAHLNGKITAVISGPSSCTDQEHEQKKESSVSTSQATFINRDENSLLEEDHTLFDSVLLECTVNSSKSSLFVENNSSFLVGKDQTQNEEDKKPLGPSTMLKPKEVVHALGCHDSNAPEAVTKHGSCTKFQKADKPKRRLLPASSVLLTDIASIDFKDENEKPKGVKAEKKGVSGENRTQGSISLLRLLKDNLAI